MKRSILYTLASLCLLVKPSLGQETFGMTFAELMAEAENDTSLQEQTASVLEMIDINSDNKISFNEINKMSSSNEEKGEDLTNGMDNLKDVLDAFKQSDKNQDNELSADEIEIFIPKMRYYMLKKSFDDMDRNKDGVYNEQDMPTPEEAEEKLKQSMQKMQEAMEKMEKMDSEEMAQNWIKSISSAIADEDYYQMDKDHDNCVTREEYVAYSLKKDETDDTLKLTSLDYSRWYIDIKKENKNCLTKEEYVAKQADFLNEKIEESTPEAEKEYAGVLFEYMDKDSNGKLTANEYAEYQYQEDVRIYAPKQPILNKSYHTETFLTIMAPNKGWMSKEEFVEDYIKQ